jgi:hypothetical protein
LLDGFLSVPFADSIDGVIFLLAVLIDCENPIYHLLAKRLLRAGQASS